MIDCILVQRRIESIEKLENVIKKLELFHIKAVFILAENAVAYLTESKVDIVISDIVLADSAGIDFMHRAKGSAAESAIHLPGADWRQCGNVL
ncbi:hypothetical protein [Sphingobacterium sp.]|uniref:hypothetical protein n=1 Tax=Sphingobacterium sp. TaxID=341027 RepID=UPI0031DFDB2C